ncbi:MAG: hypothetical protein KUG83_00915 [Gammaproteobacteria bacterium]|nr:hypothetical protein [Gammaproteobacteria bacterium]
MLILAILFFIGTGYAGYLLSTSHKRGTKPLNFLRTTHRNSALLGLSCLGIHVFTGETNTLLTIGFVLFCATIAGGFTLFRDVSPQDQKPMLLIYAHASTAALALLLTIAGALG